MKASRLFFAVVAASLAAGALADGQIRQAGVGSSTRYATDVYPGFDNEKEIVSPEKKEPRWFSFINGPKRENAKDQLIFCADLIGREEYPRAVKQLDALVREWPTAPEAARAQRMIGEIYLTRAQDYEGAFDAFRYLLDFYSLQCEYDKIADKLYKIAGLMRQEGKTIVFFRFKNTVDVRRAFETCVLRAPGAKWVPQAMLTIGELRVEEGKYDEAIKVYENLRNLHGDTPEAKTAVIREAEARMVELEEHGYNRDRCADTINFLKQALTTCNLSDLDAIKGFLEKARAQIEDEAYAGAKFYDSPTRTRRSAINAYERFLDEYPESMHAAEVKDRLEELKASAEEDKTK